MKEGGRVGVVTNVAGKIIGEWRRATDRDIEVKNERRAAYQWQLKEYQYR